MTKTLQEHLDIVTKYVEDQYAAEGFNKRVIGILVRLLEMQTYIPAQEWIDYAIRTAREAITDELNGKKGSF